MNRPMFALLCVVAVSGMARADESWLTFSDPGGGFHVDLPGTPSVDHATSKAGDGSDVITTTYDVGRTGYELTLADTDMARFQVESGAALDGGVSGVKGTLVTIVSDTICNLDGQVGREVIGLDKDGDTMDDRLFFVGGHLYQAMTVLPKDPDAASLAAIKQFRDSYHLTAK